MGKSEMGKRRDSERGLNGITIVSDENWWREKGMGGEEGSP